MKKHIIYILSVVLSAVFTYVLIQSGLFKNGERLGEEGVSKKRDVLSEKGRGETIRRTLQGEASSSTLSTDRYLNGQADSSSALSRNQLAEKSMIRQLENLYSDPNRYEEFQRRLEEAFLDGSYDQNTLLQVALHSKEPLMQDIARSISFAESVHEKGFEAALNEFEEHLFEGHEEDVVLDFLVSEVAPQDRGQTLLWLGKQDESLWQEALPAIVAEWVDEDRDQLAQWVFDREEGELKDRALAEYIAAIATEGAGDSETGEEFISLIEKIASEEIRQEVRIRTGVVNFSRSGSLSR